jgi:YHYH protein
MPSEHNKKFQMPLNPVANDHNTDVPANWYLGVSLEGVPIEAATAEYYHDDTASHTEHKSWTHEALTGKLNLGTDGSNDHVQPDGTYHYHGIPYELLV